MANSETQSKSFIRIDGDHNAMDLMDFFSKQGIKINQLSTYDPRKGAFEKFSETSLPSIRTQMELAASMDKVKAALESSETFRRFVGNVFETQPK